MKTTKLLLACLIFLWLSVSCKKNDIPAPIHNSPDIYIAGVSYSHDHQHSIATLWKNGVPTLLGDSTMNSGAISVIVKGTDVYVAGYTTSGYFAIPTYWKNGVVKTFGYNASVSGMYVQNNDVYLSGSTVSPHGFGYASYWKNGNLTNITDGASESEAYGITINGSDIYVCGFTPDANDFEQAAYWKNGIVTILAPTSYANNGYGGSLLSKASTIFTAGTDIYAAGFVEPQKGPREACVWKNGIQTNLSDPTVTSEANAIFVQGNDVFITGYSTSIPKGYSVATYWKNGVQTKIDDGYSSTAWGIAVNGSDVYIAGQSFLTNGATYWKNGVPVQLPGYKGASSASASGIAIVVNQ